MIIILNKIKALIKNKKTILIVIVLFCFTFILLGGVKQASADFLSGAVGLFDATIGRLIAGIVGLLAATLAYILGLILTLLIRILVNVAQFNNIIDVPAVEQGWVIIRDLCNMFFILILLVIAFATILRQENYSAKRLLPKLLIMAVLINFSKTIFGLIIDFAQVIMLTFVNGFAQGGGTSFVQLFKMENFLKIIEKKEGNVDNLAIAGGFVAGLVAVIITLIVVLVLLAVLVVRIVMLWIYTILSPFVFLGFAFPPMQKYTGKIWEDFSKQVIVGPVLAFFIWLALSTATKSSDFLAISKEQQKQNAEICAGVNAFFCESNFQTYIITIALLIGGLMVTQQMGGAAASIAGKGMQWARGTPGLLGKGALKGSSYLARKFAKSKHGFELRPSKIIQGFRETLAHNKEQEDIDIETKSASMLKEGKLFRGAMGASRDFSEAAAKGFLWRRAWQPGGVMQQTWKAGGVRKKIKNLEKESENKNITPERRKEINEEIEGHKKELLNYKTPSTFYATQKFLSNIQEKAKKSGVQDNEEEIVENFDKAIENGDTELGAAMFLHSAKVSHGNEIIQMHKAIKDVYNDQGKLITKVGEYFRQGNSGLRAFVQQYLVGKLGMSEQQAYMLQGQFSSSAKSVNHMNLSESVGVKNGMYYQRSDKEQQDRAHGETMKMDVETALRRLNRIGQGDEIQYEEDDGKGGKVIKRRFVPNNLTVKNFLKHSPTLDLEVNDRKRLNPNYSENLFVSYMLHKEDSKKFPEESMVDIMEKLGTSYTAKSGQTITHKQLALEATAFGADKYIGNLHLNKLDAQIQQDTELEKKIEEEIFKAESMRDEIKKELAGLVIRVPVKKQEVNEESKT